MSALTSRKEILGVVLALISLPVALAAIEAVSYFVSNRSNGSLPHANAVRSCVAASFSMRGCCSVGALTATSTNRIHLSQLQNSGGR